jgi:hypothetical protein
MKAAERQLHGIDVELARQRRLAYLMILGRVCGASPIYRTRSPFGRFRQLSIDIIQGACGGDRPG